MPLRITEFGSVKENFDGFNGIKFNTLFFCPEISLMSYRSKIVKVPCLLNYYPNNFENMYCEGILGQAPRLRSIAS